MLDEHFDPVILNEHLKIVMQCFFRGYRNTKSHYHFRCNVCGDSTKKTRDMHAYILKNTNKGYPWMYHCFKCGANFPVVHWLRLYFRQHFNDYFRSVYASEHTPAPIPKPIPVPISIPQIKETISKEVKEELPDSQDTQWFRPIIGFKEAIDACKNRRIPESVYSRWFYSIGGKFNDRIIIPFYDDKDVIYSYQGRSLHGQEPKYLYKTGSSDAIYHWFTVNKDVPVIVLEGLIDSDFVENSVAMSGIKPYGDKLQTLKNKFWLLDNDAPGKKASAELLTKGEYVFLWDQFLIDKGMGNNKIKDVNDYVMRSKMDRLTFDFLRPYFTNSLMDRILL